MSNTRNHLTEDVILSVLIACLGAILFFGGIFFFDLSLRMLVSKASLLFTISVGGIGFFVMLAGIIVMTIETLNIFKRKN